MEFKHIDVASAQALQQTQNAVMLDIRDPQSFARGRAEGAKHLTNETINDIVSELEFEDVLLVMCYHGHSSQGAAQYLVNQGFENVYSVDGGFEAWQRAALPVEVS